MKTYNFSKNKFLSLDKKRQHKKLAEILKAIFITKNLSLKNHYNEIVTWLNIEEIINFSYENISDRYHYHVNLAELSHKEHNLLLPQKNYDNRNNKSKKLDINIYLENLRSAHNVGNIIRTTEAFSLGDIYISGTTPNINNPKIKKSAMGATEFVNIKEIESVEDLSGTIISIELHPSAIKYSEFKFPKQCNIVLGNEEYGISKKTLNYSDNIVYIPMFGYKNSINVCNAYSIIASEIRRQHNEET